MRRWDDATVDLIYADPPFGTGRDFGAFQDQWGQAEVPTDNPLLAALRPVVGDAITAYLAYMDARVRQCWRVLKPTGSLYLHCDPTASHYLKLAMDAVFGRHHFRNEVVWCYRKWSAASRQFARSHDVILLYAKGEQTTFNVQYVPVSELTRRRWGNHRQASLFVNGVRHQVATAEKSKASCPDWWEMSILGSQSKERTGYPTQKPVALLERIIAASSNPGDVVLDPFCGSGTTLKAAHNLGRRWIGIDLSQRAIDLSATRLPDPGAVTYAPTSELAGAA